jgi:hypothetical protein
VIALANLTPEHQLAVVSNVETGLFSSLAKALKTSDSDSEDGEQEQPSSLGVTDSLSVKPKDNKKPPAKPAADMVKEAQAFLGKLDRTIDEVHEMLPEGRRHAECRNLMKQLGDRLKAWWREAE